VAAAIEEIEQALPPARAVEDIALVDFDHRQTAPLAVEGVTQAREFLFLGEQSLAGHQPRLARCDLRRLHLAPPSIIPVFPGRG
jgi:hypothetical protein